MNPENSSYRSDLFPRPRLNQLLQKALHYPIVSIVAGSGYGKTQTLYLFSKTLKARVVYLHVTSFDNYIDHFWGNLAFAASKEMPHLSNVIKNTDFPDTPEKFIKFLSYTIEDILNGLHVAFILDDYNVITNESVRFFFDSIIESRIENFSMVLVSNKRTDYFSKYTKTHSSYIINANDLKFSPAEVEEYLLHLGVSNSDLSLLSSKIYDDTEGWPIAVNLVCRQLQYHSDMDYEEISFDFTPIDELFQLACYNEYSEEFKKLFIRISLFSGVTSETIQKFFPQDVALAMQAVEDNVFIVFDYKTGLYTMQKMLARFYSSKQYLLSLEELNETYSIAGNDFFENGLYEMAVSAFSNSGEYDKMVLSLRALPNKRITKELSDFYLENLNKLPASYLDKKPAIQAMIGNLYFNNSEIEMAYQYLIELEEKIRLKNPTETKTLGEVYISLADLSMIRHDLAFYDYFKKAADLLPNGTESHGSNLMKVHNNSIFFLPNNEAGAIEKVDKLMLSCIPYLKKAWSGSGEGFAMLFSAEAAYHKYHMAKAREKAFQAIYASEQENRPDELCNARFLLVQINMMLGNYDSALEELNTAVNYINENAITDLYILRDCMEAWFNLTLRVSSKTPQWIIDNDPPPTSPISYGREKLIHIMHLEVENRFYQVVAATQNIEPMFISRGLWGALLQLYLYRSIAYFRLNDRKRCIDAFWLAYDMSWKNNTSTSFANHGNVMRSIVDAARKSEDYDFDESFLTNVYQKSSTYAKHLSNMIGKYNLQYKGNTVSSISLTKREHEVLVGMSQGLTREEIGDFLGISVNGVKNHIKSIYNKLGAFNRSDAIYIATREGLLD